MAVLSEERMKQVILSCLQVPCYRWLQIMISNTLIFLQLHLQATPHNSLLWIHLWPSWFWVAWVSKYLQWCGCACEAKDHLHSESCFLCLCDLLTVLWVWANLPLVKCQTKMREDFILNAWSKYYWNFKNNRITHATVFETLLSRIGQKLLLSTNTSFW